MKRILLVGGAGFLGHHLSLHLNLLGYVVKIVDNLQVNNFGYLISKRDIPNRDLYFSFIKKRLELIEEAGIELDCTDARDYHLLSHSISEFKPEVVIHLAAVSHANRSNKDPYSTFDHSLRTLENALDASYKTVEQFIYFSSSMVYGNFQSEEVKEDDNLDPIGIYGALKISGELLVKAYSQIFDDFNYTIVRPSALYGERCISRRVVQIFIENILNDETIFVQGDGQEKLDFTYVDDFVNGICLMIGNEKAYGETFNLTYGESRKLLDVVDILRKEFAAIKFQYKKRDKLVPYRGTLNIDKAKKLLGYSPEYPIDDGIIKYIGWYKDFLAK